MKILIITRIYTALADSLKNKNWQPSGMPAYYKLLEKLSRERDMVVDAVCLGKVSHNGICEAECITFDNLKVNFYVVPYALIISFRLMGWKLSRYLNGIVNEVLHFFYCLKMVLRGEHDLIYVDRANIVTGAFFAAFLRKKVVVRFFGVGSLIKRMKGPKKWILDPFKYLSYKAPFAYVICTKDGSGGRYFLGHFMSKNVPFEIILNGIDRIGNFGIDDSFVRAKYNVPAASKIILFLSRLDKGKGAELFIESLRRLYSANANFFSVIVGDGPLRSRLENVVRKSNLSLNVKFEGVVTHDMIYKYYAGSDIYVSLNFLGNLCNTVLEALSAGKCIVTFGRDEFDKTDEDTEEILSEKAVLVSKKHAADELPVVLGELLKGEQKIHEFSRAARELAGEILQSWDSRIDYEVNLLRRISLGSQERGKSA